MFHDSSQLVQTSIHDVLVCVLQTKPVAPWQKKEQSMVVDECPSCMVAVSQACLGGHEVMSMPCSQAARYSCGRSCGRSLPCGNHTCSLKCHQVISPPNKDQVSVRIKIK